MWVGIISFGFFSGFFLLPVILSWIGPVVTKAEDKVEIANDHLEKIKSAVSVRYATRSKKSFKQLDQKNNRIATEAEMHHL